MTNYLLIIAPFIAGMVVRRLGLAGSGFIRAVTGYIINFSLPCLTVSTLADFDLTGPSLDTAYVAWIMMISGAIVSYLTGKLLKLQGKLLRTFVLIATFPNTGFLGYPLSFAAYGQDGLTFAVIYDQLGMFPFFLTVGFFLAGGRSSMPGALRFPPFIALLIACAINLAGIGLPDAVQTGLAWSGKTTLPLTVLLIGAQIRITSIQNHGLAAASIAVRMLVIPSLLLVYMLIAGKKGTAFEVALMETAMPPALTTSILAVRYGLDSNLAIASISAGTLLCMAAFTVFTLFR